MRRKQQTVVHTVTSAGQSRAEYLDERQRRYLLTMGLRLVLFVAAGLAPVPTPWKIVLILVSLVLPWLAVVAANAQQPVHRARAGFVPPSPADPRALPAGRAD